MPAHSLPRSLPLSLSIMLAPSLALAHPGHDAGTMLAGMLHPLGGADHVLAMVAVGLLAAQTGGRALWASPLAFVAAMVAGALLGHAGLGFPAVEPMILASIVILGVAVALALRPPLGLVLTAVAVFGAAHGWAHGAEGPATGVAAYVGGFAVATSALHAIGIGLGRLAGAVPLRLIGGAAALSGIGLAVV